VPSGLYRCRDGYVAIVAGTDGERQGLAAALDWPALPDAGARADELDRRIEAWTAGRTRAEVETAARAHGFAAAPVLHGGDQYADPHFRARGSVWETNDPVYGQVIDYGPAPKLSATPARHKWAGKPVGWHNRDVLQGLLGLDDATIADLERRGVVGQWADRLGAKPPDDWTRDAASPNV
jgi:crotonobetainyl-CoA:carnitine CoA-transferase CaiB-like acyl-CoA transferase